MVYQCILLRIYFGDEVAEKEKELREVLHEIYLR
jgi:hypothetical protein